MQRSHYAHRAHETEVFERDLVAEKTVRKRQRLEGREALGRMDGGHLSKATWRLSIPV